MRGGNVTQTANILNKTNRTREHPPGLFADSGGRTNFGALSGENKGLRASFIY